jgi:hypothetical protein
MYGFEDGFEHICGRLRIHWMWWPAIGGVGIGLGGFFFPRGLGVRYDNIAELLRGNAPMALLLGLLLAKSLMWAFSLSLGASTLSEWSGRSTVSQSGSQLLVKCSGRLRRFVKRQKAELIAI